MKLTRRALQSALEQLPHARVLRLAFSGGMDSTVLVHLVRDIWPQYAVECRAVYINHGLSPHADVWAQHCRELCAGWQLPLDVISVSVPRTPGASVEQSARDARYQALAALTGVQEITLTAHHGDDQAETFLLQALRGAGVPGLAGMPGLRPLGDGHLARPLLAFTRQQIQDYATANGLTWIEDDSNTHLDFHRNYLRHEVMPLLRKRWPGVAGVLSRVSGYQAEAKGLLDEMAAADLALCATGTVDRLRLTPMNRLSQARIKNLLRYWLRVQGVKQPSAVKLEQILRQMLDSGRDAQPMLRWGDAELRRYRDCLYLQPVPAPHGHGEVYAWDLTRPLRLPGVGQLTVQTGQGPGLRADIRGQGAVEIRYRQGGEVCRLPGRQHHHTLKNLFQEAGVPPWLRDRVPLVYINGELAAVIGQCYCGPFAAIGDEAALQITLEVTG